MNPKESPTSYHILGERLELFGQRSAYYRKSTFGFLVSNSNKFLPLPLRAGPSTFEPALLSAKYHDNTSQRWWRRLLTKRTVGRWRQRPPWPSTASCRIHAAGPRTKEPGKELLSSIYRMARLKLFRFVVKKHIYWQLQCKVKWGLWKGHVFLPDQNDGKKTPQMKQNWFLMLFDDVFTKSLTTESIQSWRCIGVCLTRLTTEIPVKSFYLSYCWRQFPPIKF